MITLTFKEFLHGEDIVDYGDLILDIYVVRDRKTIFYIGMSKYGIYRRWFLDPNPHMFPDSLIGNSRVGNRIYDNFPDSALWNIDLWSSMDVLNFLEIEYSWDEEEEKYRVLDPNMNYYRFCDIKYLEGLLIRYLVPRLNKMGNNWKEPNEYFLTKYLNTFGEER